MAAQPVMTAGLSAPPKSESGRRPLFLSLASTLRSAASDEEAAEALEAAFGELTGETD